MIKWIIIPLIIIFLIFLRVKIRHYFWKDRKGEQLSFKEFRKRLVKGMEGTTPLQQTKVSLISFLPIFAGTIWGIVITFMGGVYWIVTILIGSLPLLSIQFWGTWQRYKIQKEVEKTMKELNKNG